MDSILMSIQPYCAYLEMKGIKTLEIRKGLIRNWSGRAFVYVSKDKKSFKRIPEADREEFAKYIGKVAFEFVKGGIMCEEALHTERGLRDSCLTHEELDGYSKGRRTYGYRITALKIYDEPKELEKFRKPCGNCIVKCKGEHYDRCPWRTITRPPQSYMRITDFGTL